MKIRSDNTEALTRLQDTKAGNRIETGTFEATLAQEVRKSDTTGVAETEASQATTRLQGVESLLPVEDLSPTDTSSEQEVMNTINTVLDKWESYAEALKTQDEASGLRQAYGMLETIRGDVANLKETLPQLGDDSSGLQSMVDELEILAVTEQFKFNRGDYL